MVRVDCKVSEIFKGLIQFFFKGNGEVEFNEFAIWMSIKMSDQNKNQITMDLENTFKIFDENGDKFIVGLILIS